MSRTDIRHHYMCILCLIVQLHGVTFTRSLQTKEVSYYPKHTCHFKLQTCLIRKFIPFQSALDYGALPYIKLNSICFCHCSDGKGGKVHMLLLHGFCLFVCELFGTDARKHSRKSAESSFSQPRLRFLYLAHFVLHHCRRSRKGLVYCKTRNRNKEKRQIRAVRHYTLLYRNDHAVHWKFFAISLVQTKLRHPQLVHTQYFFDIPKFR